MIGFDISLGRKKKRNELIQALFVNLRKSCNREQIMAGYL